MRNIMNKNILAENMRRFGTKNLHEQFEDLSNQKSGTVTDVTKFKNQINDEAQKTLTGNELLLWNRQWPTFNAMNRFYVYKPMVRANSEQEIKNLISQDNLSDKDNQFGTRLPYNETNYQFRPLNLQDGTHVVFVGVK